MSPVFRLFLDHYAVYVMKNSKQKYLKIQAHERGTENTE